MCIVQVPYVRTVRSFYRILLPVVQYCCHLLLTMSTLVTKIICLHPTMSVILLSVLTVKEPLPKGEFCTLQPPSSLVERLVKLRLVQWTCVRFSLVILLFSIMTVVCGMWNDWRLAYLYHRCSSQCTADVTTCTAQEGSGPTTITTLSSQQDQRRLSSFHHSNPEDHLSSQWNVLFY